jgi:hypothetical protein
LGLPTFSNDICIVLKKWSLYLICTNTKVVQQNFHPIALRSRRWYKFKHVRLCLNNMGPSLY